MSDFVPQSIQLQRLTRLVSFTCPHCHWLNTVRVRQFLDFSQIASRELKCGSCEETSKHVLIGPIIEGPFKRDLRKKRIARRQNSAEYVAVTTETKCTTFNEETTVLMLRIGSSLNALRSAKRLLYVSRKAAGLVGYRDLVWTLRLTIVEIKSAIDVLLDPHRIAILEKARVGGISESNLGEVTRLLDSGPRSFRSRILSRADLWTTAYAERQSVRDWVSDAESVVWMVREKDKDDTIVHVAAAAATLKSVVPNGTSDELNLCVVEVKEALGILENVFQYAVGGFLSQYNPLEQRLVGVE
jgi:hypothetical protein